MIGIRFGNGSSLYPVLSSLPEGESIGDKQPREEVFESSGSWTHPGSTSITHVDVLLVGGGGGAGGGQYSPSGFGGAGGGGGVRRMSVPVSPGSYTVTIGAGGTAGGSGGSSGGVGGQSEFGSAPYPALSPTAYYVGGGGAGRGGNATSPNATLSDAPAEGGGGGGTSSKGIDFGTAPFVGNSVQDGMRAGRGGANGFPATTPAAQSSAGGAGGNGQYQYNTGIGGKGSYGFGGGGSGSGDPGSNGMKWYCGTQDGGAGMQANPTLAAAPVPWGGYPWNFNAIPGTGGGGAGGSTANPATYARQGTAGGSGLCVVRWWE